MLFGGKPLNKARSLKGDSVLSDEEFCLGQLLSSGSDYWLISISYENLRICMKQGVYGSPNEEIRRMIKLGITSSSK